MTIFADGSRPSPGRARARRVRALPHLFLATAVTLAALLGTIGCGDHASAPAAIPPAFAPIPVAPRGPVDWPIVFSWQRVPGADWIYRVTVTDQAERVLMEHDTRETRLAAPEELKTMLGGAVPASWRVAIVGEAGKTLVSSDPVGFALQ